MRCADVVALANQSLLVNVSAPIYTGPTGLVRQTIYWPLQLYRRLAGFTALRPGVDCAGYRARYMFRAWTIDEEVPYLDVAAALAPDCRTLVVSIVNRHPDAPIEVDLRLVGMRPGTACTAEQVGGAEIGAQACNTLEDPHRVGVTRSHWDADALRPRYTVSPCALTMLTLPLG